MNGRAGANAQGQAVVRSGNPNNAGPGRNTIQSRVTGSSSGRADVGNFLNLRSGSIIAPGGASRGQSANVRSQTGASLRENVAGRGNVAARVTPNQVNNFLSINRGSDRSAGNDLRINRDSRGSQSLNLSNRTTANRVSSNNWRNLDRSQINRINNNVNVSFRNHNNNHDNHNHHGHNDWNGGRNHHGFGYGYRNNYWNNWAGGVRGYGNFNRYNGAFNNRFWATNFCNFPNRRSYYWWGSRPASYWWNCPTWGSVGSWFSGYGWNTPNYYGYGPGGNIAFTDGYVYMNEQPIATVAEYAASAAALAEVPVPVNPEQATEWLPLGTFALSEGENDKEPTRVIQLAVDKDGIVSGTMTNQETKQTFPIQGRVDKETQRVAFTIGDNKDVVLETGIYNLTQQQTPVLAHGDGREETYLLLRLDPPTADSTTAPGGAAKAIAP